MRVLKDRMLEARRGRVADMLLPPQGMWHAFLNEDHTLHLDESQAVIFATILRSLA